MKMLTAETTDIRRERAVSHTSRTQGWHGQGPKNANHISDNCWGPSSAMHTGRITTLSPCIKSKLYVDQCALGARRDPRDVGHGGKANFFKANLDVLVEPVGKAASNLENSSWYSTLTRHCAP